MKLSFATILTAATAILAKTCLRVLYLHPNLLHRDIEPFLPRRMPAACRKMIPTAAAGLPQTKSSAFPPNEPKPQPNLSRSILCILMVAPQRNGTWTSIQTL
jgi:hypothetical protein